MINSGETLAAVSQTSRRRRNYHDAMMTLRDSSTSAAVSLCWGSNTSSFRIRHTVFSDTRPSLWGGGGAGRENFICKTWLWVTSPQSRCWKKINNSNCVLLISCDCCQRSWNSTDSKNSPCHVQDKYSLWDGVLSSLDLPEELLRYTVVKGELAIQHGKQDHAKSPHVTRFSAVRPTWQQEKDQDQWDQQTWWQQSCVSVFIRQYQNKPWRVKSTFAQCHYSFCPMTQGWSTLWQVQFMSTGLIINMSKNKHRQWLPRNSQHTADSVNWRGVVKSAVDRQKINCS